MAFPTTSVLDAFTRANNASLGASWGAFVSGDSRFGIVSNQAASSMGNWSNDVWTTSIASGNQEAYATCGAIENGFHTGVYCRVSGDNTSTPDGYSVQVWKDAATDTIRVYRMDNNSETQLGASVNQEVANGDAIGIEANGTTIKAFYKASAGSWTEVASRTDSTYAGSNTKVGIGSNPVASQRAELDDFGGGAIVVGGTAYSLDCQPGSFVVTGAAATLARGLFVNAAAGSYAVTGAAATTARGLFVSAEPGSYSVIGAAATLGRGLFVNAASGSYTLTGTAATTAAGRVFNAEPGVYNMTGSSATLGRGLFVSADAGSYTVTGVAAATTATRVVSADAGSYAVTGSSATLAAARLFNAEPGAYTLTGFAAGLDQEVPGQFELNAEPTSYTLTGAAASPLAARLFTADPGTYTLTGVAATVGRTLEINAGPAVYTLTGVAVTFIKTNVLSADPAAYVLTGVAADLRTEGQAPNMDEVLTGWIAGASRGRTGSGVTGRLRQPVTGSVA